MTDKQKNTQSADQDAGHNSPLSEHHFTHQGIPTVFEKSLPDGKRLAVFLGWSLSVATDYPLGYLTLPDSYDFKVKLPVELDGAAGAIELIGSMVDGEFTFEDERSDDALTHAVAKHCKGFIAGLVVAGLAEEMNEFFDSRQRIAEAFGAAATQGMPETADDRKRKELNDKTVWLGEVHGEMVRVLEGVTCELVDSELYDEDSLDSCVAVTMDFLADDDEEEGSWQFFVQTRAGERNPDCSDYEDVIGDSYVPADIPYDIVEMAIIEAECFAQTHLQQRLRAECERNLYSDQGMLCAYSKRLPNERLLEIFRGWSVQLCPPDRLDSGREPEGYGFELRLPVQLDGYAREVTVNGTVLNGALNTEWCDDLHAFMVVRYCEGFIACAVNAEIIDYEAFLAKERNEMVESFAAIAMQAKAGPELLSPEESAQRERLSKIFVEGLHAGHSNTQTIDDNPYTDVEAAYWNEGFMAGTEDEDE